MTQDCIPLRTNTQLLAAVRDAIYRVMTTGQATTFNGETYSKAQLESLIAAEKYYENKVAQEQPGVDGKPHARNRIIYVDIK